MERIPDSKGLAFIKAAAAAMPKAMGDRDYVSAMAQVMSLAIDSRFQFAATDGPALNRFGHDTCVGVFRPLDSRWYVQACIAGGTYPAMWEKSHKERPWKAPFVVYNKDPRAPIGHRLAVLENNRVYVGLGVVLPMSMDEDPEAELDRFDNFPLDGWKTQEGRTLSGQVWWVTSAEDSHIMLCRYKPETQFPVRRKKVLREEWAALVSQ